MLGIALNGYPVVDAPRNLVDVSANLVNLHAQQFDSLNFRRTDTKISIKSKTTESLKAFSDELQHLEAFFCCPIGFYPLI